MENEDPLTKENETLSKELKIRTVALERLTAEYEKVKDKVRKYRAQKHALNYSSSASEDSETVGKLISEVDEAKSREAMLKQEVDRLLDIIKEYEIKIDVLHRHPQGTTASETDFDEDKVRSSCRERTIIPETC